MLDFTESGSSVFTLTGIAMEGLDPAICPDLIGRKCSRSIVRRWPGPGPAMTVWAAGWAGDGWGRDGLGPVTVWAR